MNNQFDDQKQDSHLEIANQALAAVNAELKVSEDTYRRLFESMMDAFVSVDMAGRIQDTNPAYQAMLGYSVAELKQLTYADLTPEKWHALEARIVSDQILKRGYSDLYEKEYRKKDGTIFPIELRTLLIRNDSGQPTGMWAIIRDISLRKQTEKALRESEMLLRESQLIANLGSYILDIETGAWQSSEVMDTLFGIGPSYEHSVSGWIDIIHPDDRVMMADYFKTCVLDQGRPFNKEYRIIRPDTRATRWVHGMGRLEFDTRGRPIKMLGTIQDITERKLMEQKITNTAARLETIVATEPECVKIISTEGRLLEMNPAGLRMLEASSLAEVQSKPLLEFIAPEYRTAFLELHKRVTAGQSATLEFEAIGMKGQRVWMETHAVPLRDPDSGKTNLLAVTRDITTRKQSEAALRETQAILQAAMDNSPAGIAIADAPNGTLRYVNNAGLLIRGGDRQTVVNGIGIDKYVASWHLLDLDGRPLRSDEVPLARAILFGETCSREFIISRTACDDRIVLAKASPIRNENGTVVAGIVVFLDITDLKQAEADREKIAEQLKQAQKMESIGRLAGGVAHDFNNMLGVILGHTEMAMEQVDKTEPIFADLEEINKAAQRSASLTRQLLAFGRKQIIAPIVIDLNDTVTGMHRMLRRLIGAEIDLVWRPDPELWRVKMDPSQIDMILVNLCINARDAIAGVGRLTLGTKNCAADDNFCARNPGAIPGDHVVLSVSDSGSGMDKETLSHLFEPFFTTKAVGKGTGLGLSTVYGIINQNNGFINVSSEPGRGTTFMVYLPRYSDGVETEQTATPKTRGLPTLYGNETLLLVEDEPTMMAMTKLMLEKHGYTVLAASTPDEALRLAGDPTARIHLLLTDVIMPEMNGRALANILQRLNPALQCLFMSAYPADVITHQGILNADAHFIQKPFTRHDLATRIREVLSGHR